MVAVSGSGHVSVRSTIPGEGAAIAALWRELWLALEAWGGYPGSRDPAVYAELGRLLDANARARAGHPVHGRHVHLVADVGGTPVGQVEGWIERHGVDPTTALTCEVRSLIVTERARELGVGRILMRALAASARIVAKGSPCVLAAEVLEPNPARQFYERLGYGVIGHSARVEAAKGARMIIDWPGCPVARVALSSDASAIARLDGMLAARRRAAGDVRFDPPRGASAQAIGTDAVLNPTDAGAASDAAGKPTNPAVLVSIDDRGVVRGGAFFVMQTLELPFLPMRRAFVGRFALDPVCTVEPTMVSLVALACRLAVVEGARYVEVADLSPPGTELYEAARVAAAAPWSRTLTKVA
jgi:GNAT superfamily N-acetyltransferase